MSDLEKLARWIAEHGVRVHVDRGQGTILCSYWVHDTRSDDWIAESATVRTMTQARRLLGY